MKYEKIHSISFNIEMCIRDSPNIRLGKWGRMRREYLRQAHPIVFSEMVLSETLYEHCAEIEALSLIHI